MNESLSRIDMALAGGIWQHLAGLPKATIVLSKRPVDCSRRAVLGDGKRIGVRAAGEVGCCAPCLTDHFFFLP